MCKDSEDKSQPFVKDARRVAAFENKKRCRYPSNYDDIVKHGKIIEEGMDDDQVQLALVYGKLDKNGYRPKFSLITIAEDDNAIKCYYTLYVLKGHIPIDDLGKSYFKPFGFTRTMLKKYMPVFEVWKTDDPENPYQLMNSRYLAKKRCSLNEIGQVDENDRNEKGRNGEILYLSEYMKRDIIFYVIRDEYNKLELDKSVLSVPIVLTAGFLKLCGKVLTFLPMKLGECLLRKQNMVAKFFGNIFFTPFMPIKFGMDFAATISKIPILLFVARKEKYGDFYCTLWKHELIECCNELMSNISLIKSGRRPEEKDFNVKMLRIAGTWKELDIQGEQIKRFVFA